jgi:hypothetical protein
MRPRSVGIFGGHVGGVLQLELLPFADDHPQGSGEAFFAEAALVGRSPDKLVVGLIMRWTYSWRIVPNLGWTWNQTTIMNGIYLEHLYLSIAQEGEVFYQILKDPQSGGLWGLGGG